MVKQNEEDGDAEGDVEEEDEDEVLESLSRGRGRPLDLPAELEEVLAKEVERAIKERNAPSSYAVLKQLVRKVGKANVCNCVIASTLLICSNRH